MDDYRERLRRAQQAMEEAEFLLVGGGAGLSAAAGLAYSGKRFTDHFSDFQKKYGIEDMYSGTFYPFQTEEERWAHWARHIQVNRFAQPATELYRNLFALVGRKPYFVITTNVESQFEKAGFPPDRIFEVQGNYAYLQCAKGCHKRLYYNEQQISDMAARIDDCKIPSALVPKCPVCGGNMEVNLRKDGFFVEDENWHRQHAAFEAFLKQAASGRIVCLELGVGFNTPGIIRYPFEQITYQNALATLIRMNRDYPLGVEENRSRTISFDEDLAKTVQALLRGRECCECRE